MNNVVNFPAYMNDNNYNIKLFNIHQQVTMYVYIMTISIILEIYTFKNAKRETENENGK